MVPLSAKSPARGRYRELVSSGAEPVYARAPAGWLAIPAAIACVLLLLGQATDFDLLVTRYVFNAHTGEFPLRLNFWFDVVLHHWTKYIVMTVAALTIAGLGLTFMLPPLKVHRRVLTFLALALCLAPLSVSIAKTTSARHCPWDVIEFGGDVPYERLFEPNAVGVDPGRCFPAGHASTGFALMAFYFAAYSRRARRAARNWLLAGIVAGVALGLGRVVQGAHFISHVLWAGLLCWIVMVALYRVCLSGAPSRDAAIALRIVDEGGLTP
ncbi:MAG TPA: phosphatase PAP2 family protein [Burkholderiales bacterium]|nr:phosphatase PAP2 family protein [Burkholderiales bacterium]